MRVFLRDIGLSTLDIYLVARVVFCACFFKRHRILAAKQRGSESWNTALPCGTMKNRAER